MDVCPAFIDETGVLTGSASDQPVYGIGLLIVPEPAGLTDALYKVHFNLVSHRRSARGALRKEIRAGKRNPTMEELNRLMWATRHHEYKFSAVASHNIQEYIDLLNVYFSYVDCEFHAMLMDRRGGKLSLDDWAGDPWQAYCELTKEFVERRLTRSVFAIVDLQGKPNKAKHDLEAVLCEVPKVAGCLRATSDMSVYLQLVDVLLGCVQFEWKDSAGLYEEKSASAHAKRQLASFVKSKLGVPKGHPLMPSTDAFKRWTRVSTFSVWHRGGPASTGKKKGAAMSGAHPA